MKALLEAGSLAAWAAMWALGGIWLARAAFNLRPNEQGIVGVAVGLVIQNLLANMLARMLPVPAAFWAASALTLLLGLGFLLQRGLTWRAFLFQVRPAQWVAVAILTVVFYEISAGLAIFDDYATLPVVSMLATGDIPPHFPLNPGVPYTYHYFLMLWAAQVMRIANLFPWNSLDIGRALTFGLAIVLIGVWTQRITRSRLAGFLASIMMAFGTGTRWLLLLLPPAVIQRISPQISMLGSGLQSGPEFAKALSGPWVIEGGGPFAFPFAFVNGISAPGVMAHGSGGFASALISFPILMTFNRWRGWRGGFVSMLLLTATALLGEKSILMKPVIWGLILLVYLLQGWRARKPGWRPHVPRSMWAWWLVIAGSTLFGLLQGGALTGILSEVVNEFLGGASVETYQTVGFRLVFPPAIVSAHLGVLSFANPAQMLVALAELGPLLLVLPLTYVYGWKALRAGRWYEASGILGSVLGFLFLFVEFTGSTGVRNTARLYGFMGPADTWGVALGWIWLARRNDWLKISAALLFLISIFGGIVLFGVELPAAQQPVRTYFVNDQDAMMARDFWNRLEPGALVFDNIAWRPATIFGRGTDAYTTWYQSKPEWEALAAHPTPQNLLAAGFRYAYLATKYWDRLPAASQQALQAPCVQVLAEYEDYRHDFRRLLDLNGCR